MESALDFRSWIAGLMHSCSRLLPINISYTSIGILSALLLQANVAQAAIVNYNYSLDFATYEQSTYGTGVTGATTDEIFFGIDTGPNPYNLGYIFAPEVLGVELGKYGAEISGNFDLRTGFELQTRNDSGTIDASQSFFNTLIYENQHSTGSFADFTTTQQSDVQALQTTFPNVGLDVDFVFELDDNYLDVTGCLGGCATVSLVPHTNVSVDEPVFDYNRDIDGDGAPDGLVEVLGLSIDEEFAAYQTEDGSTTVGGGGASTKPSVTINAEGPKGLTLASVTVEVPQPHTQNEELLGDSTLTSEAQDGFVSIFLDVDSWITAAIPEPAGSVVRAINSGGVTLPYTDLGVTYDLLNFGPQWDIGYSQAFTLQSLLLVDLAFSEAVLMDIDGMLQWVDGWYGLWSDLPDFTLLHTGVVDVTPTFDLAASLRNLTELTHDLNFVIEFLRFAYDFGILNGEAALFTGEYGGEVARSPVFDDTFALEGWNTVAQDPFAVSFTEVVFTESAACQAIRDSYNNYEAIFEAGHGFDDTTSPEAQAYFAARGALLQNLQYALEQCNDTTILTYTEEVCDTQQAWLQNASNSAAALNLNAASLSDAVRSTEVLCFDPAEAVVVINDPGLLPPPGSAPGDGGGGSGTGNSVPEPAMLLLFGAGIGMLGFMHRRRRTPKA